MALFVLLVVGIVVGATWLDWRDANQGWAMPEWAKGTALAGILGVVLTAASSFASAWIQDPATQRTVDFGSKLFWPELAFLACMLAVIVFAIKKKRMRLLFALGAVLLLAFWLGVALS